MGVVYLGKDNRLNRPVALEVLRRKWAGHDQARRRFLEDAQVASHLQIGQSVDPPGP